MRIRMVVPGSHARRDPHEYARAFDAGTLRPGTRVTLTPTRFAPRGAGTPYDHSLAEMATLDAGLSAERDGYDAVCIDDPADPALDALRSRLGLPVTGAGSASLWLGRLIGLPVAFVMGHDVAPGVARMLGIAAPGIAFVAPFDSTDPNVAQEAVTDAAITAVERGAACIALVGPAARHRAEIVEAAGIPAFGASMAAVKLAEVMAGVGLLPSGMTYVAHKEDQDHLVHDGIRADADPAPMVEIDGPDGSAPARRIRVVVPHSDMDAAAVARRAEVISPGLVHESTSVSYTGIATSPNRADSPYATLLMDLFCLQAGLTAAEDGFDAITVDSTTDSGIGGLRSRLPILVVGTGQATWALASDLSERFSIVAMEPEWAYFYRKNLKAARSSQRLASVRSVGTPTDPYNLFAGKEAEMYRVLTDLGKAAIEQDGAEALIVGSTTMHQAADHLAAALPVPVLNPGRVALRTIEALLEMDLRQSRVVSPMPADPDDGVFR